MILTVHVSLMLVFDECIAPRFPRPLVVDYVNLEETGVEILVGCGIIITHRVHMLITAMQTNYKTGLNHTLSAVNKK